MERIPCSTPGCPNSIPAPPEATKRTEYTCAFCIELGAVGAVHEPPSLDRCQFDNFKIRPGQSKFALAAFQAVWAIKESEFKYLPTRCRKIYLLHVVNGLTARQIAELLEISPKTVEDHLFRANRRIKLISAQFQG